MFSYTAVSPYWIILNIVIYIIMLRLYCLNVYNRGAIISRLNYFPNYGLFAVFLTVFSVCAFSCGDFYHYMRIFYRAVDFGSISHMEEIYGWIIERLVAMGWGVYFAWRLIIWGLATFFLVKTLKRYDVDRTILFCMITLFYMMTFYIMRGSLGISIMFYGLSFLTIPIPNHKTYSKFLGVTLIICSYFFHKSMLLSIMVIPLSFIKWTRFKIYLSLLIFPILVVLMRFVLQYLINHGTSEIGIGDDTFSQNAQGYSAVAIRKITLLGRIRQFVELAPVYVSLWLITSQMYFSKVKRRWPKWIETIYVYWFILVYIATLMAFQSTGGWYFSRFIYMSNYPFAIVLAYFYSRFKLSKTMKFILFMGILNGFYTLLYALYYYLRG